MPYRYSEMLLAVMRFYLPLGLFGREEGVVGVDAFFCEELRCHVRNGSVLPSSVDDSARVGIGCAEVFRCQELSPRSSIHLISHICQQGCAVKSKSMSRMNSMFLFSILV